jgi:hypothetical protein
MEENAKFAAVIQHEKGSQYFSSYEVARQLGISALALSRVTSNLMIILSDGSRINLGLGFKFEAKGMKVPGYSRKNGRIWEFSRTAIQSLHEYKVCKLIYDPFIIISVL